MTTNNFPGIGYLKYGRDFNFFQKVTVTATTFGGSSVDGYQPDCIITFPTEGIIIINETPSTIVQVSFNGNTVHDEINSSLILGMVYDDRVISTIWLQITSGSSATVSIRGWGTR